MTCFTRRTRVNLISVVQVTFRLQRRDYSLLREEHEGFFERVCIFRASLCYCVVCVVCAVCVCVCMCVCMCVCVVRICVYVCTTQPVRVIRIFFFAVLFSWLYP